MIRGIGPIYARKLVRAFSDAVFDVIEQEPSRLREVNRDRPFKTELNQAALRRGQHRRLLVPSFF
jgi:hypothetical protein